MEESSEKLKHRRLPRSLATGCGDFVGGLTVRSSHARLGVGARLMDQAEADIAGLGFSESCLETDSFNTRSQAFYASRGYREVDRYPDKEWNSGLTTLLLVKALR